MKKFLLVVFAVIVLLISGSVIYNYAIPDYVKWDEIPKGYTDCDGRSYAGKDLDEYYVYYYTEEQIETFETSDLYKKVDDSNIEELTAVVKKFDEHSDVKNFADTVSNGDCFILTYYNSDGDEVEYSDEHYCLYFFDIDSQKLHYLYQVW